MDFQTIMRRIPWYGVIFVILLTALFSSAKQSLIAGVAVVGTLLVSYALARFIVDRYQKIRIPIVIGTILYLVASGWGETFQSNFWQLVFVAAVGLLFGGGTASQAPDKK